MSNVKMPEPVAYLVDWPDEIELGLYFSEEKNDSARSRPLITTEQAEAYAQAVRDEALEEAAKRAENMHHDSAPYWVALRIRGLKKEQS